MFPSKLTDLAVLLLLVGTVAGKTLLEEDQIIEENRIDVVEEAVEEKKEDGMSIFDVLNKEETVQKIKDFIENYKEGVKKVEVEMEEMAQRVQNATKVLQEGLKNEIKKWLRDRSEL